MEENPNTY